MDEKKSNVGISSLMNDSQFNLVPKGLERLNRREQFAVDPSHTSLKDKREKRDVLKEKKFQAQSGRKEGTEEIPGKNAKVIE